jgi:hypothetical protein
MTWTIKIWDGYTTNTIQRQGTYDQVRNTLVGLPPAYIWSIE